MNNRNFSDKRWKLVASKQGSVVLGIVLSLVMSLPVWGQEIDSAQVKTEVRIKRQLEIEIIARHVAQAVLAGEDSLSAEQLALVGRVTEQLAKDMTFLEEQMAHERAVREERKELITSIVLNVAKGIAIIVALLVLRAIIGAIGRGVAAEESKAGLLGAIITTRTEEKAREIGKALVEEKLATGGTVTPSAQSIYRRQDGVREAQEAVLLLKTTYKELPDLIRRVDEMGGENIPEIVSISRSIVEY